jgi:cardiolipin synthase
MEATTWKFHLFGNDCWEAVLKKIERAQHSIDFEHYTFVPDTIGRKFGELFIKKAQEGVHVRLLIDEAGSYRMYLSSLETQLIKAGVELRFFHPIWPWRMKNISSWIYRDHRKIVIIDKKTAFLGGPGIEIIMQRYRDTMVETTGPMVSSLQIVFEQLWGAAGNRFYAFYHNNTQRYIDGFKILINAPRFKQHGLYKEIKKTLRKTQHSLYIETPYFIPPLRFVHQLKKAAGRGVDVKIIITKSSDHPFVDIAKNSYLGQLLKSGVRIFLYDNNMLHAKTIVIDDTWCTVGSANFDNLSSFFNYEANIVSVNETFVRDLKAHFLDDLTHCEEVHLGKWLKRSTKTKIIEWVLLPFHKFL